MAGRIKLRDINQDPGVRQEASGGSEVLPGFSGGAQGSIAYRGATKWEILGPGISGLVLTTKGSGANPVWQLAPLSGRATGIIPLLTSSAAATLGLHSASITSSYDTSVA